MKALIQRVKSAQVEVDKKCVASIELGLLVFLGVEKTDDQVCADKLLDKILHYRIFPDVEGKMNLGLTAVNGGLLLVSQFTLAANTQKGLRPSFSSAAQPEQAKKLYEYFTEQAIKNHSIVESGIFAADMQVSLVNDGPVTFLLDV